MAEMLFKMYLICVLFWVETDAVRLLARMNDSKEFKRELVKERFSRIHDPFC